MRTLFCGPFIGEFGWELFGWQGYIRRLSREYDRTIVASRSRNEFLYRDFCSEFVPFDTDINNCAGWTNYNFQNYAGTLHQRYNPDKVIFVDNPGAGIDEFGELSQEFHPYGQKDPTIDVDIVIHARNINVNDSFKTSRNWPLDKWNSVVSRLVHDGVKVASIGLSSSAFLLSRTQNYMDLDLECLSNVLASAKLALGPSSGPMHFASLCKCPHVVWTSNQQGLGAENKENYERNWNPFGTRAIVYEAEGWNPSVTNIYELLKTQLETIG
jgi:ADP-heptose:LPS heptosyltransferase